MPTRLRHASCKTGVIKVGKSMFNKRADAVSNHSAIIMSNKQNQRPISQNSVLIGLYLKP